MFEVNVYNENDISTVLHTANRGLTPIELIEKDSIFHVKFLKRYLGKEKGLNAKFYISEDNYISLDYLSDYSLYYSKCFGPYTKECVRLHFFKYKNEDKEEFQKEAYEAIIKVDQNGSDTSFWDQYYIGFVVVRPIPKFLIGYTILKHYNFEGSEKTNHYNPERVYWGTKKYDIHLFGRKITIDSLAFMSQDSNVAACATIAIWCMLQRAVESTRIQLKSAYEITSDAGLTTSMGNRMFPNNGLDPVSMCNAITKYNLATEIRRFTEVKNNTVLCLNDANSKIKKYINAYSPIKLPIILGLNVPIKGQMRGHAVAICGHRAIGRANFKKTVIQQLFSSKEINFRAEGIQQLYVHDDQWGPFASIEFEKGNKLLTSWTLDTDEEQVSTPITLIIPVFQKIRIPYEDIEEDVIGLHRYIVNELGDEINGEINWDIQVQLSSSFKESVRNSGLLDIEDTNEKEVLNKLLKFPMPKYIWTATMFIDDDKIFTFIYDSTGLRYTNSLLTLLCYYPTILEKFLTRLTEIRDETSNNKESKYNSKIYFNDSIDHFIEKMEILSPK